MKKWVTIIVVLLALATSASALEIKSLDVQTPAIDNVLETAINYRSSHDSHIMVSIPDLDVYAWHTDLYDDTTVKEAHIVTELPDGIPPGDYLVRYVISDDDDQIAMYRWVTIE